MKKRLVFVTIMVFSVAGMIAASPAFSAGKDVEGVRAAVEKFYSALNVMFTGDLRPMKAVWSHQEDVTYMGPGGGFRHGWKDVLADWEAQAALKLGGRVEPKDLRITVGRDLAIVNNYEIGHNVTAGGKTQVVKIRATNLFRKEKGKWKMIGHHTDLLPFLRKNNQ